MNKKERIEALIRAYEQDIESCELLMRDFEKQISEMKDAIWELRHKRTYARNEIKALNLISTDPDGNWTPGIESHEERRRQRQGWFVSPECI